MDNQASERVKLQPAQRLVVPPRDGPYNTGYIYIYLYIYIVTYIYEDISIYVSSVHRNTYVYLSIYLSISILFPRWIIIGHIRELGRLKKPILRYSLMASLVTWKNMSRGNLAWGHQWWNTQKNEKQNINKFKNLPEGQWLPMADYALELGFILWYSRLASCINYQNSASTS